MEFEIVHIWLIATVVFFILEIFVPSFVMASIAIGCLLGAFGAWVNGGIPLQLFLFSIGGIVSFFTIRPLMLKYAYKNTSNIKTNVEAIVGRIATVSETIDSSASTGRVILDGDDWKAKSLDNIVIEKEKSVEIIKVESIILYVKPLNK